MKFRSALRCSLRYSHTNARSYLYYGFDNLDFVVQPSLETLRLRLENFSYRTALERRLVPIPMLNQLCTDVAIWFDQLSKVRVLIKEKDLIYQAIKEKKNHSDTERLQQVTKELIGVKLQLASLDHSIVDMIRLPNHLLPGVDQASSQPLATTEFQCTTEKFLVGKAAEVKWRLEDQVYTNLKSSLEQSLLCSPPHFVRSAVIEACQPPSPFSEEIMSADWNVRTLRLEDITSDATSAKAIQSGQHIVSDPISPMVSTLVRRTFSSNTIYPMKLFYPNLTIYQRPSLVTAEISQFNMAGFLVMEKTEQQMLSEFTKLNNVLSSLASSLNLSYAIKDVPIRRLFSYEMAAVELLVYYDGIHATVARVGLIGDYLPIRLMMRFAEKKPDGHQPKSADFLQMSYGWVDLSKLFQFLQSAGLSEKV